MTFVNCPVSIRNSAQPEFNYNDATAAGTYFRFVNYVDALNSRLTAAVDKAPEK